MTASVRPDNKWLNKLTALIRQDKERTTDREKILQDFRCWAACICTDSDGAWIFPECAAKSEVNAIHGEMLSLVII